MVTFVNGAYKLRHDRFLIEVMKDTYFTSIYVREEDGKMKLIKTIDDQDNIVNCTFIAIDLINDYNKKHRNPL